MLCIKTRAQVVSIRSIIIFVMVNPQDIYLIATALALVLGAIGGVPQILKWFKPKPHLRIIEAEVQQTQEKNKYILHLKILNEARWLRRTSDATDVKIDTYIMDKNYEQWSASYGDLTPYLLAHAKVSKEIPPHQNFKPGEPYTFIIVVYCAQGVGARKKITYLM